MVISLYTKRGGESRCARCAKSSAKASCNDLLLLAMLLLPLLSCSLSLSCWPLAALDGGYLCEGVPMHLATGAVEGVRNAKTYSVDACILRCMQYLSH